MLPRTNPPSPDVSESHVVQECQEQVAGDDSDAQITSELAFDMYVPFPHPVISSSAHLNLDRFKAFLVLHEITAIAPLYPLYSLLQYTDVLPTPSELLTRSETLRNLSQSAAEKAQRVAEKYDLFGGGTTAKADGRERSDETERKILSLSMAYLLVKIAMPIRLTLSLALTPAFARWVVVPATRWVRYLPGLSRRRKL